MLKIAENGLILHYVGSFGFSRIFSQVPPSDFDPAGDRKFWVPPIKNLEKKPCNQWHPLFQFVGKLACKYKRCGWNTETLQIIECIVDGLYDITFIFKVGLWLLISHYKVQTHKFRAIHRRNRTFKPSIGPVLGQYKRPDWASRNAITTGPLQARLQLGQYKRLLELAHIKWLDLAQVQQMRRAFFSTNWLVSSLLRHGGCWWFSTDVTSFNFNVIEMT